MRVKKFSIASTVLLMILFVTQLSAAQTIEYSIRVVPEASMLRISAALSNAGSAKSFAFTDEYAGVSNLSKRINDLRLLDFENKPIAYRQPANGIFFADAEISKIFYTVKIPVPENTYDAAHASWLSGAEGFLSLRDLLPQINEFPGARVSFDLPDAWSASPSPETTVVENVDDSVFFVGKEFQTKKLVLKDFEIFLWQTGDLGFQIEDAAEFAAEILSYYSSVLGAAPAKRINVFLLKLPGETPSDRWRAEARGSNVWVLSSSAAFRSQEKQRLHEQLRHELFHLWIPNKLSLSGNYDWFYEGFAQYAALRAGVMLNRITFNDFLNTINQAIDLGNRSERAISLIDESRIRWTGGSSTLYARGLAVAFLCELAFLRTGKTDDLFDFFRLILQKHGASEQKADGNAAILDIFASYKELEPVFENYIKGSKKIDPANHLDRTGFESTGAGGLRTVRIKSELSRREKDLLDKLGYNNWRKIFKHSK